MWNNPSQTLLHGQTGVETTDLNRSSVFDEDQQMSWELG
jgi:hypothetical protein